MIELENISIGYKTKRGEKIVASGISAQLHSGQLTCLIGANGIGKSTLLKTLSAFLPPLEGHIYILGERRDDINSFSDKELSRLIGVVLTEKPDVQNMTVSELVALGRSPYTGFWGQLSSDDLKIVEESIRMVGVSHISDRQVQSLSDGERQKMMIAKALAQQTPVIFLDEPTAFLDYPSKVETMKLLHRLSRETNKTIFLSTHDLELALQIADTLWLMMPGNRLHIGKPRELAANGAISDFVEGTGIHFDKETMRLIVSDFAKNIIM